MDKRNKGVILALIGVFILFALLVPVYWTVSNGSPDGLDKLLEQQNVEAKAPVYSPPLAELQDYGLSMPLYVVSGTLGGLAVLVVLILIGKALKHDEHTARN